MNYFISQKMRGRSEADILAERQAIYAVAVEHEHDDHPRLVPSYHPEYKNLAKIDALGKSFSHLSTADVLLFPISTFACLNRTGNIAELAQNAFFGGCELELLAALTYRFTYEHGSKPAILIYSESNGKYYITEA